MAGTGDTGKYQSQSPMKEGMGLGILVQIQVTPRWEIDPVWIHVGRNGREGQGGCRYLPPLVRKRAEGGEGRSGSIIVAYVTIDDRA